MATALILDNIQVSPGIFLMTVQSGMGGRPGQFYMLRSWRNSPLLSRPISIYDVEDERVQFLYQVAGEGTRIWSRLRAGDEIGVEGPYGNGFPEPSGRLAFVGGGIGLAPFNYALKHWPGADVYLGFSHEAYLVREFERLSPKVIIDIGGYITDRIDLAEYDQVWVCGPEPMMLAMQRLNASAGTRGKVYVSLENRMACGIGACLVCSIRTSEGRKKACSDGPVFPVEEVVFE
ncbi:dihydroorotate dehydrogenase electron transfer subunit [Paenibacillus physcomitrellae]|uniref:Dihydroorotate dehydrogenase n=1 Tax=Paenibacillus physcomitrellae TaxID=1619311 RepID=A0ABQ1FPK1_9BACL|nr:dihydroorotate dehydrogenase electron transfer subunit [Paenibacillus physcomitrellae]GGA25278.1 dihydroorotate dehydrogenase [Paenibacillus physcomitrellae]